MDRNVSFVLKTIYFSLVVFVSACSSWSPDRVPAKNARLNDHVLSAFTKNGEKVEYDSDGGRFVLLGLSFRSTTDSMGERIIHVGPEDVIEYEYRTYGLTESLEALSMRLSSIHAYEFPCNLYDTSCIHERFRSYISGGEVSSILLADSGAGRRRIILDPATSRSISFELGVSGTVASSNRRVIPLKSLDSMDIGRSSVSVVGTALGVVGGALLAGVVILGLSSCPLISVYDGHRYVLDSEPLGGAICKGLQRTDLTRIDYADESSKDISMVVANQPKEQQFIDELKMYAVTHERSERIVFDLFNKLYAIPAPMAPFRAVDEKGVSIREKVMYQDSITWRTSSLDSDTARDADFRNHLTFSFVRPKGEKNVGFVFKAGTSQWGAFMMKEVLTLHGEKLGDWYDEISTAGPAMVDLQKYNEREEHYFMKLFVKKNGRWKHCGYMPSHAPLVYDEKVAWVNVGDIESDTLEFAINPPKHFWNVDYVGMVFGRRKESTPVEVEPFEIEEANERDVRKSISITDGNYLRLEKPSQAIKLRYRKVDPPDGTTKKVSYLMKVNGYYDIQLGAIGPEKTDLLQSFLSTPSEVLRYSMKRYQQTGGVIKE